MRQIRNLAMALLLMTVAAQAQTHDSFANFERYANANEQLPSPAESECRVVLMGNSITDNWPRQRPQFFSEHPNIIGRGISGQTSYQFLRKFCTIFLAIQN